MAPMSDHTHTNTMANTGQAETKAQQYDSNGTNGASAHSENGGLQGFTGYQGTGGGPQRFITPGGNPVDATQPAFPVFHRR